MASSSRDSSSSSEDVTSTLRSATFSSSPNYSHVDAQNPVTASDVLSGKFDPTLLHPLASIQDQLEYLQLEDDKVSDLPGAATALPSRGWSDDLCYGTGTTYLSGTYFVFAPCPHELPVRL